MKSYWHQAKNSVQTSAIHGIGLLCVKGVISDLRYTEDPSIEYQLNFNTVNLEIVLTFFFISENVARLLSH